MFQGFRVLSISRVQNFGCRAQHLEVSGAGADREADALAAAACKFIGPYGRTAPRALWWQGGVLFLMSEAPLYTSVFQPPPGTHGSGG